MAQEVVINERDDTMMNVEQDESDLFDIQLRDDYHDEDDNAGMDLGPMEGPPGSSHHSEDHHPGVDHQPDHDNVEPEMPPPIDISNLNQLIHSSLDSSDIRVSPETSSSGGAQEEVKKKGKHKNKKEYNFF